MRKMSGTSLSCNLSPTVGTIRTKKTGDYLKVVILIIPELSARKLLRLRQKRKIVTRCDEPI